MCDCASLCAQGCVPERMCVCVPLLCACVCTFVNMTNGILFQGITFLRTKNESTVEVSSSRVCGYVKANVCVICVITVPS